MSVDDIRKEIARRQSFIHDALIGQSPEDLERHRSLRFRKAHWTVRNRATGTRFSIVFAALSAGRKGRARNTK